MALRAQSLSSQGGASGVDERLRLVPPAKAVDERSRLVPPAKAKALISQLRARRQERDSAEFIAEAQRQSLAIAQSPEEAEDMDFVEAISMMVHRTER